MNKENLTSVFHDIIQASSIQLLDIKEAEASKKSSPGEWSKKEILGHLIDSALNNHRRFMRSFKQQHLVYDGYNQENWVKIHDYQNRDWMNIVLLWKSLNELIEIVIISIPNEKFYHRHGDHNFNRICWKTIDRSEKANLTYLFADYIGHLEHHLSQIFDNYMRHLKEYSNSLLQS